NFLPNDQHKSKKIEPTSLLGFSQLLQKRLHILCRYEVNNIVLQRRPLGTQPDRQHKGKPERRNQRSAPRRPLKPGESAATAREISAIAQCVDESRIVKNGKRLPKQDVDEHAAEHPNQQDE